MDLSCFSTTYPEARDKFLHAATARGATLGHWPHPLKGPGGEALSCDTAWLGPEDAAGVLVVVSATHGVEGLAGSGPQVDFLRGPASAQLPPHTAVLLVHAINPHGFAWLRRVTEENVDLNRNWVDFTQPLPANPGYAQLHEHYVPRHIDAHSVAAAEAAIEAYRQQHGLHAERVARSTGQYTHPTGIFYGGSGPTWARRTSEAILARHLAKARTIAIVDMHTGLGPFGYGEPICNHAPGSDRVNRAKRWWGESVTEPLLGTSSSQEKFGLTEFGYERCLAHADIARHLPAPARRARAAGRPLAVEPRRPLRRRGGAHPQCLARPLLSAVRGLAGDGVVAIAAGLRARAEGVVVMISIEFLVTSLVVVRIPGTGVLYAVSTGLVQGRAASL